MQELETLLTPLINMGWKPKDREVISIKLDQEFTKSEGRTIFYCSCKDGSGFYADLRWIVSLESGLWQFVCNNGLHKNNLDKYRECFIDKESENKVIGYDHSYYQYRLLESALILEEELGKFLLDNIKLEGK